MLSPIDDDLVLLEDEYDSGTETAPQHVWRILVVDDDQDVHEATGYALSGITILDRPLQILHAHSGKAALEILAKEPDVAVILLDVVMESDDAGLKTVDAIRNTLKLVNARIILRTGQPGQAPEAATITRYDINDYKTKSELNQSKLLTTLITAIRSYNQLLRLDASRRGLEKIVAASNQFIAVQGLQAFAEGVITQIAGLIGISPDGLVCAEAEATDDDDHPPQFRIIAAAGHFSHLIQRRLSDIEEPRIAANLTRALTEQRNLIAERDITLYFRKCADQGFAAFIDSATPICEVDQHLLEVFCTNIALCAKNIDLVSALRRDAFFDRQVGLPNRMALIGEIDARLKLPSDGLQLIVIDIDQFAAANDVLGHRYGDALLNATARRLKASFDADVHVARLAGDAFALFGRSAQLGIQRLQQCFDVPFVIEGIEHSISACAGLVSLDSGYCSGAEALKDGYFALRRAKEQGIGQNVMFCRAIGSEYREHAQLLRELRHDFEHHKLFLAFQPQVDLASGALLGVEALLRWRHTDGNMVPPDRFIPIAEQSGLIVSMGGWLLQAALRSLQRFRAAGFPALRMAVNISPVEMRQPDFLDLIQQSLRNTGTAPENLELEITESVAVVGLDSIIPLLNRLRAQGVSIAIDDFGTGYSSLSYLERLPANRLKIDRSFIMALANGSNGARITRTVILLGTELGMRVVAEGVEDLATAEHLRAIGCHEAQGYCYGQPMPEDEFMVWLENHQKHHGRHT